MISYPGEILARFGRYEAVELIEATQSGQLWRAWDPFLERFVLVASLAKLSASQVFEAVEKLDRSVGTWTAGRCASTDQLLDFAPPGEACAYLVCALGNASAANEREAVAGSRLRSPAAPESPARVTPTHPAAGLDDRKDDPGDDPEAESATDEVDDDGELSSEDTPHHVHGPALRRRAKSKPVQLVRVLFAVLALGGVGAVVAVGRHLLRDDQPPPHSPRLATPGAAATTGSAPAAVVAPLESDVTVAAAAGEAQLGDPELWAKGHCSELSKLGFTCQKTQVSRIAARPDVAEVKLEVRDSVDRMQRQVCEVDCSVDPCRRVGDCITEGDDVVETALEATAPPSPEVKPIVLQTTPPAGPLPLTVGTSRELVVRAPQDGLRYEWRLNGQIEFMSDSGRWRFDSTGLTPGKSYSIEVVAIGPNGAEIGKADWTLQLRGAAAGAAAEIAIHVPKEVVAGTTVRIGGPALKSPFDCEWSVNGEFQTRACDGFEWKVPAAANGRIVLKVTAPDRRFPPKERLVPIKSAAAAPKTAQRVSQTLPTQAVATPKVALAPPAAPDRSAAAQAVTQYFRTYFRERTQISPEVEFAPGDIEAHQDRYFVTGRLTVDGSSKQKRMELRRQGNQWVATEAQ